MSAAGLRLLYSGDQFADVVEVAFDQVPDASPAQIAESLKYYAEHDTSLDR